MVRPQVRAIPSVPPTDNDGKRDPTCGRSSMTGSPLSPCSVGAISPLSSPEMIDGRPIFQRLASQAF